MPPTALIDIDQAREHGWTSKDVLLAEALIVYEDGLCHRCGHPMEESTDPMADPDNPRGTHVYEVTLPTRCHACTAVARAEDQALHPGDSRPASPWPAALHWSSRRTAREQRPSR